MVRSPSPLAVVALAAVLAGCTSAAPTVGPSTEASTAASVDTSTPTPAPTPTPGPTYATLADMVASAPAATAADVTGLIQTPWLGLAKGGTAAELKLCTAAAPAGIAAAVAAEVQATHCAVVVANAWDTYRMIATDAMKPPAPTAAELALAGARTVFGYVKATFGDAAATELAAALDGFPVTPPPPAALTHTVTQLLAKTSTKPKVAALATAQHDAVFANLALVSALVRLGTTPAKHILGTATIDYTNDVDAVEACAVAPNDLDLRTTACQSAVNSALRLYLATGIESFYTAARLDAQLLWYSFPPVCAGIASTDDSWILTANTVGELCPSVVIPAFKDQLSAIK